jgi:metallo-beta-lactamase class B
MTPSGEKSGTRTRWRWRRGLGLAVFVVVMTAATAAQSARSSFKSDPAIICDACPGWNATLEPFRIFGNTYYVGTRGLSSVLVTSRAGHILLDGGLPQSAEIIDRNVRELGYRIEDIKLIVNSHAHYDHAGGIHALQQASGASVAASASGASALMRGENTTDDPQYGFGRAANGFPPVANVRVVKDGEMMRVGQLSVTAHLMPGHTPGSTTWTWKSCEGSRCLDVVYADSLTATVGPGFKYSSDPARVSLFRKSIETVAALPCDIVVSVHPDFTNLMDKIAKKDFVNPQGCREYATFGTRSLDAQLARERE